MKTYPFNFSVPDIQTVLNALTVMPYREASPIINRIELQVAAHQAAEQNVAAKESPEPAVKKPETKRKTSTRSKK